MERQRSEILNISAYLCVSCGKIATAKYSKVPCLHVENGRPLQGLGTISKYLAKKSKIPGLLGIDLAEQAVVNQWLEYRVTQVDRCANEKDLKTLLKDLNDYLSARVFLVGHHITLADILLYYGLHPIMSELTFSEKQDYLHLSRWFDQIQHTKGVKQDCARIAFLRTMIYSEHCH